MEPAAAAADLAVVSAVGGLLALERRGAFQLMLSQPIVAVPLLGFLMGDVMTGVWLGSLLQLLWMSSVLFGANVPPNETLASVSIAGVVLLYGRYFGTPDPVVWTVAILVGAPLSLFGRSLEIRLDRSNRKLAERADEAAKAGLPGVLSALPPLGLLRALLVNSAVVSIAVAAGVAVLALVRPLAGTGLTYALQVVGFYVVPAVGIAVALTTVPRRRGLVIAAASYVALVAVLHPGWG